MIKKTTGQRRLELKIKISKKSIGILIVVLLIFGLAYFSKSFFIAAIVNGQPISNLTIIKTLEKQGGKKILDTIITQTLILQEAKKRNITVNPKDIDAEIKKIETNVTAQGSTLDQVLQQQGMKKSDLVNEIKLQLIVQKIVGDNITVADNEIEEYINAQKNQFEQNPKQEISKEQAKQQIKQQKLQQKIQELIKNLKQKAKITYFAQY